MLIAHFCFRPLYCATLYSACVSPDVLVEGHRAVVEGESAETHAQKEACDSPDEESGQSLSVTPEGQHDLTSLIAQKHLKDGGQTTCKRELLFFSMN